MCLAIDGSMLISCSEDGSICIWEVQDFINKISITNKSDERYIDDVLVNWPKLDKINNQLNKNIEEVKNMKNENTQAINKLKSIKEQEIKELINTNSTDYDDTVEITKVIKYIY